MILLCVSAVGLLCLSFTPHNSARELLAATTALAPILAIIVSYSIGEPL